MNDPKLRPVAAQGLRGGQGKVRRASHALLGRDKGGMAGKPPDAASLSPLISLSDVRVGRGGSSAPALAPAGSPSPISAALRPSVLPCPSLYPPSALLTPPSRKVFAPPLSRQRPASASQQLWDSGGPAQQCVARHRLGNTRSQCYPCRTAKPESCYRCEVGKKTET